LDFTAQTDCPKEDADSNSNRINQFDQNAKVPTAAVAEVGGEWIFCGLLGTKGTSMSD